MDRLFDRAFSKVHGDVLRSQDEKERKDADTKTEETVTTAAAGILKHFKNKEYFKMMDLAEPTADELGRPVWTCTSGDVSRAYRRLSITVHPDKNPGNVDARAAFEALNEVHRLLKDQGSLEEILNSIAGKLRREREKEEARIASSQGIAAVMATKNAAAKRLRKEESAAFEETIRQQMKKRQEEAARKAAAVAAAKATALQQEEHREQRRKHGSDDEDEQGNGRQGQGKESNSKRKADNDSEDDDDASARRRAVAAAAAKRRKKPTIMH